MLCAMPSAPSAMRIANNAYLIIYVVKLQTSKNH